MNGKVKKLQKQVASLQQQIDDLSQQTGPQGPQGPPGPSTGSASGDLTGNYPAPTLAPGAVNGGTAGDIVDNSIVAQDVSESSLLGVPGPASSQLTTGTEDPTQTVANTAVVLLNYSSPNTITDLINNSIGQVVTLVTADANPTINDGGNFALSANWTPNANDTITLVDASGVWYEVARSAN